MDELEKNERLGDLFAYYGPLLTKGQQEYFEDYYYNDLSLGEIADNHHVSRQAVYDNLKRSSRALEKYEDKLHMKRDYTQIEEKITKAVYALEHGKINRAQIELLKLLRQMGVE